MIWAQNKRSQLFEHESHQKQCKRLLQMFTWYSIWIGNRIQWIYQIGEYFWSLLRLCNLITISQHLVDQLFTLWHSTDEHTLDDRLYVLILPSRVQTIHQHTTISESMSNRLCIAPVLSHYSSTCKPRSATHALPLQYSIASLFSVSIPFKSITYRES